MTVPDNRPRHPDPAATARVARILTAAIAACVGRALSRVDWLSEAQRVDLLAIIMREVGGSGSE